MDEKQANGVSGANTPTALIPNKIFFINSSSGDFSDELHVSDLSSLSPMESYTGGITESLSKRVQHIAKEKKNDASTWAFELTRKTFSSTMQIHSASMGGEVVAELDMSVLKQWGTWTIRFPEESDHSNHDVEIHRVGIWRKEETFIKDSTLFSWDLSGPGKSGRLYQVSDGERVLVAEFVAKHLFRNSCVLVLNDTLMDEVVVLATCVAVLNRQN